MPWSWFTNGNANPFMPCGFVVLNALDRSFSKRRGVCFLLFFFFISSIIITIITMFYRNSCITCTCKQCWPWSDSAFCGVWSGSILLSVSLLWDTRHKVINLMHILFYLNKTGPSLHSWFSYFQSHRKSKIIYKSKTPRRPFNIVPTVSLYLAI